MADHFPGDTSVDDWMYSVGDYGSGVDAHVIVPIFRNVSSLAQL